MSAPIEHVFTTTADDLEIATIQIVREALSRLDRVDDRASDRVVRYVQQRRATESVRATRPGGSDRG